VRKSLSIFILVCSGVFIHGVRADFFAGTAPYRPFGEIEGFNIMEKNPDTLKFLKLGVQNTDIVVSVNGNPIRSLASAKKAYSVSSVKEVVVLRKHRPLTLSTSGGVQ
jgi:hypothetical protein